MFELWFLFVCVAVCVVSSSFFFFYLMLGGCALLLLAKDLFNYHSPCIMNFNKLMLSTLNHLKLCDLLNLT